MDRREFLRNLGVMALAILGISRIIQGVLHEDRPSSGFGGYGSSPYGGNADGR